MDGPWADYAPQTAEAGPWMDYQAPSSRHFKVTAGDKSLEFDAPQDATDEQIGKLASDALTKRYGGSYQAAIRGAPEQPSTLETLGRGAEMTLGGVAKGVGYLADAGANALGALGAEGAYYGSRALGTGADALGFNGDKIRAGGDFLYENWMHPATIGRGVDAITGGPQTTADYVNDFGGQLMGGAQALGQKAITNVLAPQVPKSVNAMASEGQRVAQAAQRQSIKVLPADVGGPFTRKATAGLVQSPLGAGPIVKAAKESVETFGAARDRVASSVAPKAALTDAQGGGEAAQAGARASIKATGDRASQMFDAALKDVHPNTPVVVDQTIDATRKTLNSLSQTPGIANILQSPALKKFGAALASDAKPGNGSIPLDAARKLRSEIGAALDSPSLTDDLKAADLKRVYGALSSDIERAVEVASATGAAPKGALARLKAANAFYKQRMDNIDQVLSTVLGRDGQMGGQKAFEAIERLAKERGGDPAKLDALVGALPRDQRNTVISTIISRLGQAAPGAQNDVGTQFSPARFLTHWNEMSKRGKDILFKGELRAALDDLAKVAGGIKEAGKYANHSNTAGAEQMGNLVNMATAVGGTVAGVVGKPALAATAVLSLAGQYGGAKLLSSPFLVRQLTRISTAPTKAAALAAIKGLGAVGSREPSLAAPAKQLQEALTRAMNDNVRAVAASSDQKQDERK